MQFYSIASIKYIKDVLRGTNFTHTVILALEFSSQKEKKTVVLIFIYISLQIYIKQNGFTLLFWWK